MNRIALALLLFGTACAASTHRRPLERVASMDPIQASAVYDSRAVSLVYEPLLEVDYEARPYRLKAGVCDLPDVSADRLAYTFRLRDGVRFQDDPCFPDGKGRLATAEDIVYSLERLRDPKNASSGMWTMDYVQDVKAVDARTVRITLKKPFHVFPWLMAMAYSAVVPHEALEKYGTAFGQHAVGTGPYRLTEWWRNYRMIFTRDAGWRGWAEIANPAPYDKIEYVVVGDLSTQWLMFLGKELDCLGGVDRNNWDAVVGKDGKLVPSLAAQGVRLLAAPTLQVMYVGVNMDDPLLGKNKKLRQALNCAFDAPEWKKFLNDRVEPADGPLPPGVDGRLETPFAYAFNVEKAKKLLVEAGFPGGVDPKTGKRLVLPIALGRADQGAREEVELLQGFYDRVGIRLEPQFMTWAAYLKTRRTSCSSSTRRTARRARTTATTATRSSTSAMTRRWPPRRPRRGRRRGPVRRRSCARTARGSSSISRRPFQSSGTMWATTTSRTSPTARRSTSAPGRVARPFRWLCRRRDG